MTIHTGDRKLGEVKAICKCMECARKRREREEREGHAREMDGLGYWINDKDDAKVVLDRAFNGDPSLDSPHRASRPTWAEVVKALQVALS